MPRLHKLYYILAAVHVFMIMLFSTHMAEWGNTKNIFGKAVQYAGIAGNFTGSNNIFSFFAPGLSDQPYVVYAIRDSANREQTIDLLGRSPDFSNRINNIYGYLTLPEARPVISASLASYVLRRYPAAEKVRVAMVVQQLPLADEYRAGQRSRWRLWFHRDFQKDK